MIDFIPILKYTYYFDITILCLILIALWQCHNGSILNSKSVFLNAQVGIILLFILILYMGLRPNHYSFGDTIMYAKWFDSLQESNHDFSWTWHNEWGFHNLIQWFAIYSNRHLFFLTCSIIYIGSLWLATIRIFKQYYYIPFLIILCMFTFWDYGVNGIRNGLGASLFILAITYINRPIIMIAICIIAASFHNSIYIMICAGIISWYINNSKYYLYLWMFSIISSYFIGEQIQSYLGEHLVIDGDLRLSGYLTGDNMIGETVKLTRGFRWDFLIYSSIPTIVGFYFIFRRNFKDEYYHWIYNIYLITNSFWIIIIRAAYSNRFAQISWFIMPLVLIYPFMKQRFWHNHEKVLGFAIIIFYAFTFYYNIWKI